MDEYFSFYIDESKNYYRYELRKKMTINDSIFKKCEATICKGIERKGCYDYSIGNIKLSSTRKFSGTYK